MSWVTEIPPGHTLENAIRRAGEGHSLSRNWVHPSLGAFLRELRTIAMRCHDVAPGPSAPVYLARTDADRRKMLNEEHLCERLAAKGFEIVATGSLSYRQQLEMFSGTRLLLGPAGGGLTNMVYTPPGTPVVELRPLHTRKQSPLFDFSHRIPAALVDRPHTAWFFENEEDTDEWCVDVERVAASVEALL